MSMLEATSVSTPALTSTTAKSVTDIARRISGPAVEVRRSSRASNRTVLHVATTRRCFVRHETRSFDQVIGGLHQTPGPTFERPRHLRHRDSRPKQQLVDAINVIEPIVQRLRLTLKKPFEVFENDDPTSMIVESQGGRCCHACTYRRGPSMTSFPCAATVVAGADAAAWRNASPISVISRCASSTKLGFFDALAWASRRKT